MFILYRHGGVEVTSNQVRARNSISNIAYSACNYDDAFSYEDACASQEAIVFDVFDNHVLLRPCSRAALNQLADINLSSELGNLPLAACPYGWITYHWWDIVEQALQRCQRIGSKIVTYDGGNLGVERYLSDDYYMSYNFRMTVEGVTIPSMEVIRDRRESVIARGP